MDPHFRKSFHDDSATPRLFQPVRFLHNDRRTSCGVPNQQNFEHTHTHTFAQSTFDTLVQFTEFTPAKRVKQVEHGLTTKIYHWVSHPEYAEQHRSPRQGRQCDRGMRERTHVRRPRSPIGSHLMAAMGRQWVPAKLGKFRGKSVGLSWSFKRWCFFHIFLVVERDGANKPEEI